MKRISLLLAGVAIAAPLSFAQAADYVDPAYDWSGFYFGAHVGYGTADAKGSYDSNNAPPQDFFANGSGLFDLDVSSINGGVQAGYNWQVNSFVFGLEADASLLDWDDKAGPNGDNELVSIDADWLATMRLRAGYAVDNLLLYGTAGAAFTDAKVFATDDFPANTNSGSKNLSAIGLALGGGLEYAFAQNWSVKAEALYIIFNEKEGLLGLTNDSDASDFVKLEDAVVARVGLNYQF